MQNLNVLEIGVMFWAGRDPHETLREVKSLGVRCGQIGIPGELKLDGAAAAWNKALADENFTVVTVFAAYEGENYADLPTVQKTVGWIPAATRAAREQRTYEVADFAAAIGAPAIALHVGFVPDDDRDLDYLAVREMVRRVCDYAGKRGMNFALETGQEPAEVLLRFFLDVNRDNLRINFDPANLILYGSDDPVQALDKLGRFVVSVHAKDGDWPPKDKPEALGEERPLGQGAVGIPRFVDKLKQIGYKGPLCVEREVPAQQQRLRDIRMAVELLQRLR